VTEEMKALIDEVEVSVEINQALESSIVLEAKTSTRVMYVVGLEGKELAKMRKSMSNVEGLKLESSFSDDVTHVLFKSSKDLLLDNDSVHYYKALLAGKWILSFDCKCL
jgi:hypothetical protein